MSYGRRQGGSYEGRRGHGKGFKRCPVEMGKEYEVDVTEMSRQRGRYSPNSGVRSICC